LISGEPIYSTPSIRKRFSCGRRPEAANKFATVEFEMPGVALFF